MSGQPDYTDDKVYTIQEGINALFIIISTGFILLNQAGFAILENGLVRPKNSQNILIKNIYDTCAGAIAFWLVGYAFAYGQKGDKGGFIGSDSAYFAASNFDHLEDDHYLNWIFQFSFAATATTIVSGSIAERTKLTAYAGYSIFMTGFIYPVVVSWTWGEGWLYKKGFTDFAGTGIVHLLGGIAGLAGALIVGPRYGKGKKESISSVLACPQYKEYEKRGSTKEKFRQYIIRNAKDRDFENNSVPFVVVGTIILLVSWLFFNGGSIGSLFEERKTGSPKVLMNTIIAGATSGIVACYFKRIIFCKTYKYDVISMTNGLLCGLVSITGVCDDCEPWAAFIIGIISGFVYSFSSKLLEKLYIDDPIEASAVHGFGGMWGLIATGLFSKTHGVFSPDATDRGTFFGWQLVGLLAITAWAFILSGIYFFVMKKLGLLRVSVIEEVLGLDICNMGMRGKFEEKTIIQRFEKKDSNKPMENDSSSLSNKTEEEEEFFSR